MPPALIVGFTVRSGRTWRRHCCFDNASRGLPSEILGTPPSNKLLEGMTTLRLRRQNCHLHPINENDGLSVGNDVSYFAQKVSLTFLSPSNQPSLLSSLQATDELLIPLVTCISEERTRRRQRCHFSLPPRRNSEQMCQLQPGYLV